MRSRMMVVPKLFSHWWETLERPSRLMDQQFGMQLRPEQLLNPFDRRFPFPSSFFDNYFKALNDFVRDQEGGWSVVKDDKDKFHVILDVQQFKPEEVNIKVVDNYIVVEGKHEAKEDDHGIVSRHFVRKYMVPEQCDIEQTTSTLSSDGVLTITAPRKPESLQEKQGRTIQIEQTGKPSEEPEKMKMSKKQ